MIEHYVASSLITHVHYDIETYELTVFFNPKYFIKQITHLNCPPDYFDAFVKANSVGKFYLDYIKPNLKIKTMADESKKLPTKNRASSKTRQIDMDIDLNSLNKDWFWVGEKINEKTGKVRVIAKIRLLLKPDGEIDKYGNLGMVVQQVPSELYKKEKNLPDEQKSKGNILGNGSEIDWDAVNGGPAAENVSMGASSEVLDDLPF